MEISKRLDRIEESIDSVALVLQDVVRLQERQAQTNQSIAQLVGQFNDHEQRMRSVEKAVVGNSHFVGGMERFVWVAVSVVAAFLSSKFG